MHYAKRLRFWHHFGIAITAFWDGITLHSILQWHHMLSGKIPVVDMDAMHVNMFADGLFDLFCWIVTLIALAMLYREARRGALPRGKTYIGWMLIGGGAFNFIEGLVDHELLGIHHVHPGPNWLAWDIGFLVIGGMLLVAIGWVLKQEQERSPAQKLRAA